MRGGGTQKRRGAVGGGRGAQPADLVQTIAVPEGEAADGSERGRQGQRAAEAVTVRESVVVDGGDFTGNGE